MADGEPHLATIKPRRHAPGAPAWRVPALTILYHPGEPGRAGEVARLVDLLAGKDGALSRQEPDFVAPGAARGSPLLDRHISRTPVRLAPDGEGVRVHGAGTSVRLDGLLVTGPCTVSREDLERGVVVELADRVVLLLHLVGPPRPPGPRLGLVGQGQAMERLRGEILRIADLEVPVLLLGETGTGKELVARAIAASGPRSAGPFVGVNLAAIPASIAPSELFGHAAGAFTGASAAHAGHFAQAQGGTLFLDEIGAASPEVQAMLLRALETREIQPLGSERRREVEVRVLAATDEDLELAIRAGRFRESLYQRLAGYQLDVPPLRARREDFGALLVHFLGVELRTLGEPDRLAALAASQPWLPPALVARLARADWPGNVRQLANVARRLVVASRGGRPLDEGALPPRLLEAAPPRAAASGRARPEDAACAPSSISEERLQAALRENGWRIGASALALGISRTSLYALIDASPSIRRAKDVPADEIRACHATHAGDVDAMAEQLRVSGRGIRLRLKDLGLA